MDEPIIHPNFSADAEPDLSESLTARVASLNFEARELAADADIYRLMMQCSTGEIFRLTRLVQSQSATISLLRDELRRYVEAQMRDAA